jgi:hypothetical protein
MTKYNDVEHKETEAPKTGKATVVVGNKDPKDRPPVKPIVHGKKIKKGLLERLVIGLIGPDGIPKVGRYLNHEIVIPAIKDIVVNSISSGVQMMMYGTDNGRPNAIPRNYSQPSSSRPYYSQQRSYNYSGAQSHQAVRNDQYVKPTQSSQASTEDIQIDDRTQALEVLAHLEEDALEYGVVTLAEFYDLTGVDSDYTDNNFGWTYEMVHHDGRVAALPRGGYVIVLPHMISIG